MKKPFAALLLLGALAAPLVVSAADQRPGPGRQPLDQAMQQMTQKLNLTPDQQPKVRAAIEARRKTEDSLKAQGRAAADKMDKEIMAVLTPDQQTTYKTMISNRRGHRPVSAKKSVPAK